MYESFYGITRRPFLADPDPGCCAGVKTMQQAYDELFNCFNQGKGIGILTGSSGTGKTLLCLKLLEDLSDLLRGVFLAGANYSDRRSLLQAILYELESPYRGLDEQELRVELITAAKKVKRTNRSIFLVVDEAHLLNETLLEEIRSATNLIENGESLVRVLLSGQMPLEETMTRPALDALNQRVGCHQSLETLTRQQSIDYIEFRIKRAGTNVFEVFTAESLQLITEAADGNPRCLNQLCDHALFLGFANEEKPIETATLRAALEDLKQLPLHWNDLLSTTDGSEQSAPDSLPEESFSDDFYSDDSYSDDSYSDGSLIEEASAEASATVAIEAGTEAGTDKTGVFEIGVEETVEYAETKNDFELDAAEDREQLTEIEIASHEISLESDPVRSEADLEIGIVENVAVQVSNLETLIRPLEIDTSNIGITLKQSLENRSMDNRSMVIQSIVSQSTGNSDAVCLDKLAEVERNASGSLVESFDEVALQPKVKELSGCFEEEPVEDLYASLDAETERAFHQSSPVASTSWEQSTDEQVSTSSTPQEEFDQSEAVPISASLRHDPLETVWYSSDDEIPANTGPEDLIDQMLPLLNEAAELPVEELPSETPQQDRDISEPISTEIEREPEEPNAVDDAIPSEDPLQDLFVSNAQFGSTVFDTCLETQQADVLQIQQLEEHASETQPNSTSRVLFSNDERLQLPVQFDVVRPEERERILRDEMVVHEPALSLENGSGQSNKPETAASQRPKYDQLFSELRRRRLA